MFQAKLILVSYLVKEVIINKFYVKLQFASAIGLLNDFRDFAFISARQVTVPAQRETLVF